MFCSDFAFICQSTPVFSHPLLRSITLKKSLFNLKSLPGTSADKIDINDEKFLDPLGVSSLNASRVIGSTVNLENGFENVKKTKRKLTVFDDVLLTAKFSGIDELAGCVLNNTLSDELKEEELDLDPVIMNFRPWRELKIEILKTFNTQDRLSIESSFLNTGSLYLLNGKAEKIQEKGRYHLCLIFFN